MDNVQNDQRQPNTETKRPKTGGRKKGTPNKITKDLRGWLAELINSNRATIKRDLRQLDSEKRLVILEKLMQYVVPKQQAIKTEITQLTENEVDEVAARLLDSIQNTDNEQWQ